MLLKSFQFMIPKLVKDVFNIIRAPISVPQRLQLLNGLIHVAAGSGRLFGWNIAHLGRLNLILLYSEIFARQSYRFASSRPDPVVYDCGANIGMATFYFKWLYPKAHIDAFEPDASTFRVLKSNIERNRLEDTLAHNFALGGVDAEIDFHVPQPGSLMMSALPTRTDGQTSRVACRRLSGLITGPIDLLKLDVEGMEGPVLQDLADSGKLSLVQEAIIEVHHNLSNSPATLGHILQVLECARFQYHVLHAYAPSPDCATFQDVLIHGVRKRN